MSILLYLHKAKKTLHKISTIGAVLFLYLSLVSPALATLYTPGTTLEPDCPPTESLSTCGVISGDVSVGGTGITSYTIGDLLYASGIQTLSKLAIGTNGQVLKVSGGNIIWGSGTSPNIGDTDLTLTGQRVLDLDGNSLTIRGAGGDTVFNNDGSITGNAQNLTLARIGNSTFSTLQDLQNVFHSAGYTSGGEITDAGGETVNVAAGTGLLRSSNTAVSTIAYMDWDAVSGIAIPTNSTRYIGIEYNGGSPQISVRTSSNWNLKTDFSLGVVVNEGGVLNIFSDKQAVGDHAANMVQRDYETMPLEPDVRNGGLIFSETGTRNIVVTAGAIWDRLNRYTIPTFNTSISGDFDAYYMNGSGGFTKVTGLTQWPNTKYDDGSGTLATLTDGKYGVLWFYLDTNAKVSMVYGMGEYDTAGLANSEMELGVDMLPPRLSTFGKLIGKIVFQKNASSATNTESLIGMSGSSGGVTNHAGLSDLDYTNSGHTGFANAIAGVNDNITSATGLASITPGAALTITAGGASTWSTTAGALAIDSAAALNIGTTNATAINIGKSGIVTTNSGDLAILGNMSTPKAADYSTTGTQNNVNLGAGTYFHYTGVSAATFTGIAGGTDGRIIYILNDSASNLTLKHLDSNSSAENRIENPNGGDVVINQDITVSLIYDADSLNWHMLSVPTTPGTIGGFAFIQNGNAFGSTATLGTTDANGLNFITGGATRFSVSAGSATLTGTGATSVTGGSTLSLLSAAGSALSVTSGTTGALTLDSGSTGAINIGTNANAKTVTVGNSTGATAVNVNTGTGGSTYTTTNGAFSLNTGTGAINLGTDAVAKNITVGNITGATGLVLNAGSGGGVFTSSNGLLFNPFGTSAGNTTEARFGELAANGSNYVGFKSPDVLGGDVIWTLPDAGGTVGQVLTTDGLNNLSWASAGACPTCVVNTSKFNVDGNGNITKLNNLAISFPNSQGSSGDVLTNDGAGNLSWSPSGAGSAALSGVTAATGDATIGNGNSNINWNWTLSGATNGFNISESTASSGTGYLQRISTLATSAAKPFSIGARGTTIFNTTATGGLTLGDSATLNTPITLQSGSGAINIGTDAVAKTVTIGNTTGATALNFNSGSGGINFGGNTAVSGAHTFTTGSGLTTINSTAVNLAGNSSVIDMAGTGVLGINTTTNRDITTGTGLFTASGPLAVSGTATTNGALSVVGNYATPKGADYVTTGSQNDVDLGTGSLFRYAGTGTATFTGIAGGTDGRFIRVINTSSFALTFSNESASSAASNRIITATNADIVISTGVAIGLQYDSGASRWRVVVLPASSASVSGFAFIQNGNAFGTTATLGTTDANGLNFITGGATRFSVSAGSATLTGTGATNITSSAALSLDATTALNLGTTNATSVAIGKTGVTTTNNGSLTSTQTLTASNGLTLTTGALNIAASSGAIDIHLANITGASPLVFEGSSVDGTNKTTFAITEPTGVRTITFPDASITVNAAGNISGTTLASNVVNSSLTSVGTLSGGSITSGFGSISTTNNITTSANISTTGSGTVTSAGTLTASNGLTQTTGSLNLTATAGTLSLSGLSASSINSGINDITFTSGHFNTTATGINNTAIGATTKSTGAFTTFTSTGATDLANAGASNVTIATTGTGNVTIGNSTGTFQLTSSGGLNVTTGGALTGVASIDTIATSATGLTFAGAGTVSSTGANALTLDGGSSGALNLNNNSTGNLLLGGGSGSTGCTLTNATGAFDCTGAITGSNLSGTNTGDQTTITGNAGTATALQTARTINGTSFDGTANITITAAAGTVTGATLNSGVTASSLTSVGALNAGSITSGFGAIDTGADNITTTGSVFANDHDRSTAGALTFGNTNATSISLCNSAGCDTISIGTNADADTINIGDTLDALSISSSGFNVTSGGALTGVASLNTITASATGLTFAGAGTLDSTSAALNLGTSGATSVSLGKSGITTTNNGALTVSQTLTASNGLTLSSGTLTLPSTSVADAALSSNVDLLNGIQTITGAKTFNSSKLILAGATSGTSILNAASVAGSTTFTLPGASGTIVTTGDTGSVTSTMITNGTIANTDLASGAFSNITGVGTLAGLTVSGGTADINTSGSSNTTIGNSTGTFQLTSNGGLNVTTGGALTGVASINTISASDTALTFAGAGTISGATTLTLNSTGSNAVTVDSTTTGAVNIGTGSNAKTVSIGNGTGVTALNFTSGTGLQTFASSASITNAFNFNANSITTGSALQISATALNTTGSAFKIVGPSSLNLLDVKYVANNFGATVEAGAFMNQNATFSEDFNVNKNVTAITADNITGLGDSSAFAYDTFTGTATTYTTPTSVVNGVGRFTFPATSGTGFVFAIGRTVAAYNGIYLKANLPVVQMKIKPSLNAATEDTRWGLIATNTAASGTNDATTTGGIYFSSENGTSWVGVVRSGGANVGTVTCTGTISTTQFSVGKIVVESATSVRFYMDYDASDGISYTDCGAVSGANPTIAMTLGIMNVHTVASASTIDVDYMRTWQDDTIDNNLPTADYVEAPIRMFTDNGNTVDGITLISNIKQEAPLNIIESITEYIQTGSDFAMNLFAARVTALRGYFDEIFTKKIHTDKLCIKKSDGSEVCVDGDQISTFLQNSGIAPTPVPNPTPVLTNEPTVAEQVVDTVAPASQDNQGSTLTDTSASTEVSSPVISNDTPAIVSEVVDIQVPEIGTPSEPPPVVE